MAGGMDLGTGGKGGKKPLDTQINLVPFIDLMAVTISFLIMTAVWTQIGRLQVSNTGNEADEETKETEQKPLFLVVSDKELRLNLAGSQFDPIPIERDEKGRLNLAKLQMKIKELKAQLPEQSSITVQPEDTVRYEDLVRVIDEVLGSGLPNVSVASAMG